MDYQSINPATEERVRRFPTAADADIEAAVGRAHGLYRSDWGHRPIADRSKIMGRAAQILRDKAAEYAGYITLEVGKLARQAVSEVNMPITSPPRSLLSACRDVFKEKRPVHSI